MKISNVIIQDSNLNEVMDLGFKDPSRSTPYLCKAIYGLDSDEINPSFYGKSLDGQDSYYNMIMRPREIVIRVQLNPNFLTGEDVSDLRDRVYRSISSSRSSRIKVLFKNEEDDVAYIHGFVQKLEAAHFNKQPELQITVKCEDPFLIGANEVSVPVDFIDHGDILIEDEFSTAPHGLRFVFRFTDDTSYFNIKDSENPIWEFRIIHNFLDGETLHFSSEYENKYIFRRDIHDSDDFGLVDKVTSSSVWPMLFFGENRFLTDAPGEWEEITYSPVYWGV